MPQGKPQTAGRLPRTLSAFRRLFLPDIQTRARPRPVRPVRPLRPRAPQSIESQAAALDTLINAEPLRAGPPPELRSALSELVGISSVFSTRRLSRTARDPADGSRPRHPPPHYDRIERPRTRRTRTVRNPDADVGTGWARSVELERETSTTTATTSTHFDTLPRHVPPHYGRIERPRGRMRRTRIVRNPDADVGTGWARSVEVTTPTPTDTRHPPPHYGRIERPRGRMRRTRTVRNPEADVGTGWARSVELEKETTTGAASTSTSTSTPTPTPTHSDTLNIIHARYNHFLSHSDVQTVVDIGAGTGSWSLYVGYKLRLNVPISSRVKIIAVDREPLGYMRGIERIQGDICDAGTQGLVDGALEAARVDVVLCDVTLETAGSQMMDAAQSLSFCRRVWEFARWRLRTEKEVGREGGGVLLMRHVPHPLLVRFRTSALVPHFRKVKYIRPEENNGSYFICWGYKGT